MKQKQTTSIKGLSHAAPLYTDSQASICIDRENIKTYTAKARKHFAMHDLYRILNVHASFV